MIAAIIMVAVILIILGVITWIDEKFLDKSNEELRKILDEYTEDKNERP